MLFFWWTFLWGCDGMENRLFQPLPIPAAAPRRPGCVSRSVACSCRSSPHWGRHAMYDWQRAPRSLIREVHDRLAARFQAPHELSANGSCRPRKEDRGARCLPIQRRGGEKWRSWIARNTRGAAALRWNGMESRLSYNAIQATALAACGAGPLTLSGQGTESLFPLPRHVFLTWSPSASPCGRLGLT